MLLTGTDLKAIRRAGRDVTLSEQMRTCACDLELDGFVAEAKTTGRWNDDPAIATTLIEVRREIGRRAVKPRAAE